MIAPPTDHGADMLTTQPKVQTASQVVSDSPHDSGSITLS